MSRGAALKEPVETPLTQALHGAQPDRRSTPLDAFTLAREWFLQGRRLDMQQLATELGVGRATLYRWCRSRELLLGEVISSIQEQALAEAWTRSRGQGADRLTATLARLMGHIRSYEPLQRFVGEDAEYALRVLTSKRSVVQRRTIDWCVQKLRDDVDLDPSVDPEDLAYAIVRVCEAFVWSDMITGAPPETEKGARMAGLLISAAKRNGERS
jgi:AcrR family transcriptional regulator